MKLALRLSAGGLLMALGAVSMALTLHHPLVGLALALVGGALAVGIKGVVAAVVVSALAFGGRLWMHRGDVAPASPTSLAAGEYRAHSSDLLRLVSVRAVVRRARVDDPGVLIFVEGHAPPGMGIDHPTLWREANAVLEAQGIPDAPLDGSDPATARLFYEAVSTALSGRVTRVAPQLPPGAQTVGDQNTYWDMFPNEFDHACDFTKVPDGRHVGTSSNPAFPASVRITVTSGRLARVDVLDKRSSGHGEKAFEVLPGEMVAKGRADVDIISGATRSSWILRSAVYHACQNALAP